MRKGSVGREYRDEMIGMLSMPLKNLWDGIGWMLMDVRG